MVVKGVKRESKWREVGISKRGKLFRMESKSMCLRKEEEQYMRNTAKEPL